jgi:hypothetical protein
MSLRALSVRAAWRDAPQVAATTRVEPAVGGLPAGAGEVQKMDGALTDAVPTEVLGPYTAAVAIIVANASAHDPLSALRWGTYAGALVLTLLYVIVAFRRDPKRKRKLPWVEMTSAVFAAAAWGLAMPESPLSVSVHGSDLAVASGLIALGGGVLVGLFTGTMRTKSTKAPA